jgi:hypothetical protein
VRAWTFLLGGLLVWTAHFFALYAIASILETSPRARLLTALATLAGLAADGWLLSSALARRGDGAAGPPERWADQVAALGAGLSAVAVLWQGLPALLV